MSYHEEQETLEEVKAWWARWGNLVTWVALIVLVALAAYNGWNYWQRREAARGAQLYEQLQAAAAANDKAKVARIAADMESNFARTPYAPMGGLTAAAALQRAGDAAGAKAQLQWVVDHSGDAAYRDVARLRLAGLLLDEKAYAQGLALLDKAPVATFEGLFADRRGDLLQASGQRDKARDAYRLALAKLPASDASLKELVQFKIDANGG
ncbi:YfgM family protein [Chitinasiproducens palmae]|uniref:Negative regulator of RcsB-dependent stress response n=1 Tax=Chitinasiproducens palmae TaxID=1770053 RepID=A0A1H2PWS2_9BURK|nr:tetratricopeptide repeat protein [Chitinasiproducens palmae]SDV51416.1 Putative negative regulator of RcsB-dependent stress response [Chitinasiproducens palmae]